MIQRNTRRASELTELERRQLLAFSGVDENGVLLVQGTAGADVILVQQIGATARVNGGFFFPFGTQDDTMFGLGGNDYLNGFYADPGLGNDIVLALVVDYSHRTAPLTFVNTGFDEPTPA